MVETMGTPHIDDLRDWIVSVEDARTRLARAKQTLDLVSADMQERGHPDWAGYPVKHHLDTVAKVVGDLDVSLERLFDFEEEEEDE